MGGDPVIPPIAYEAVVYGLATAFLTFAFVSACYAARWWYRERKFTIVKVIFSLLPVSTMARGIVMAVSDPAQYLTEPLQKQDAYQFILGSLPGYLMLSISLLLSLFWYCDIRDPMVLDNLKVAYIVCNAFIYLGWLTLVLAFSILKQQKKEGEALVAHTVEAIYATTLSMLVAFASVWYGFSVYRALNYLPVVSERRNKLSKKVAFLAIVLFCTFVIRSVNIAISFWVVRTVFPMFLLSSIGLCLSELFPSFFLFALLIPAVKEDLATDGPDYGTLNS